MSVPTPDARIAKAVREVVEHEFAAPALPEHLWKRVVALAEKPLLEEVMQRYGRNQTHTAAALGVDRNTLRKRLRAHGIKA